MMRRAVRLVATLVVAALLASGCSLVGGGGGHYTLVAYFPRAVSLYPSGEVRVLGLPAGTIDSVEVVGTQVKVTMSIDKDIPVPANVKALIVPQSLIGERYVQLSPAWQEGMPKATDHQEIHDTVIPVEPDEALAALKKFLDSLDPNGLGRLIDNAATDLKGQGTNINHTLDQVSQLVQTFAEKDQTLVDIVDHFDQFTSTLATRETQLGDIIQTFSQATQVLADERQGIQDLLNGLANLSQNGLTLVANHSGRLRTDLETLSRLTQSIDANLNSLGQLLDSGPQLVRGILGAYNPTLRAINLRTNLGPLASLVFNSTLQQLFNDLGLPPGTVPTPCVPIDQACPSAANAVAHATTTPVVVPSVTARTPIDDLLGLVSAPTVRPAPAPSTADRLADAAASIGAFLREAAGGMGGGS